MSCLVWGECGGNRVFEGKIRAYHSVFVVQHFLSTFRTEPRIATFQKADTRRQDSSRFLSSRRFLTPPRAPHHPSQTCQLCTRMPSKAGIQGVNFPNCVRGIGGHAGAQSGGLSAQSAALMASAYTAEMSGKGGAKPGRESEACGWRGAGTSPPSSSPPFGMSLSSVPRL